MNFNQLSGSIPPELGNLSTLQGLGLNVNQLTGSIPTQLGSLASLQYLGLSSNQLSGNIPAELGSLANLQYLILSHNQLSGSIPAELGSLANLQYLYLSNNDLTSSIPPELGSPTSLQDLSLSHNQLSGSIPLELGSLTNLQYLSLNSNQLTGSIPPELGNLSNLAHLILQNNQLSGSIPPELGSLVNLADLDLQSNQLSGSIPPELGNLTNLVYIDLGNNQLSGSIPPELASLTNVIELYLHINQLTGSIPPELGDLANLHVLNLSTNQLTGTIPSELGNLASVTSLSLDENQLSSSIPPELGSLTNLQYLRLHNNALEGEIPSSITNLTNLYDDTGVDIGYNTLTSSNPAVIAFLADKDPDWADTQTISPTGLGIDAVGTTEVTLTWMPITYTQDGGYYEVYTATQPGGPFNLVGDTITKTASAYTVTNLLPGTTYYFQLRTYTPAHGDQQNDLWSAYTEIISATTIAHVVADFTASPTSGIAPLTVTFTNTSSGDYDTTLWDFGDGITSTLDKPDHMYLAAGIYTVTLTVSGLGGLDTLTQANFITVSNGAETLVSPEEGGALIYTDTTGTELIIEIPAGAVTETLTLRYTENNDPITPPAGFGFANLAFDLTAYLNGVALENFVFQKPITITIAYTDADVAGLNEGALALYYWDGSAWADAACGAYVRDLEANLLSVPICHLSGFGLFARESFITYLPQAMRKP